MATRSELITLVGDRYRAAAREERSRILDEFVATTGYHRKHAVRLLARAPTQGPPMPRRAGRTYGPEVREALVVLWEASDRLCSKRLRPLVPVLLPAPGRHGQLVLDDRLRSKLLSVSAATIDRLLAEVRTAARGGSARRAGFSSAVRRSVPVRTFGDWSDPPPGYLEVDFVAHAGTSAAGSFIQTLVLTDVATGWTECVPVLVRDGGLVIEALRQAMVLFPFPLRGVDFDNDSAFMNEPVVSWCRAQGLEVTRSRAYRKNDQAWVEQKNGALVRRLVGYGRFEGLSAAEALARLYAAVRIHANLFQPSFKLRSKVRVGAKVTKRYHPPVPPASRVLAHPGVHEAAKARLRGLLAVADPVLLVAEVRAAQADLGRRVGRKRNQDSREVPAGVDLQAFARSLKVAWRGGERRPTHRRPYVRKKPVARRPSMMDKVEGHVRAWMEERPGISAQEVLDRLMLRHPGEFTQLNLRQVQRAVKRWRGEQAERVLRSLAPPPEVAGPAAAGPATSSVASKPPMAIGNIAG